ncbi:MAG TPA: response regulator [Methylomirabilota bacterium]|nr:response regulator [Methylomirabilota bacterium]
MPEQILIVDDEPDMLELLSVNLREAGFEVITARAGKEALDQARRFLPDLILLDLVLPDLDGLSVCEILRCQASTAGIPVIILTAVAGQIARCHGLAAGAEEFHTKPVNLPRLRASVREVLERAEVRRLARELETPDSDAAGAPKPDSAVGTRGPSPRRFGTGRS